MEEREKEDARNARTRTPIGQSEAEKVVKAARLLLKRRMD